MEKLTDLSPYLAPETAQDTEPRLVFEAPGLILTIPLPPWSSLDDLDDTSGLIVIDDSLDLMITWDAELPIDGYSRFRMVRRGEAQDDCSMTYTAAAGKAPSAGAAQGRRISASEDGTTHAGIDLFPDPFRRAKTVVSAFCERHVGRGAAYLQHLELFDGFDIEDESAWPIARGRMVQRLEWVSRLMVTETAD